jgi:hypothetical protein
MPHAYRAWPLLLGFSLTTGIALSAPGVAVPSPHDDQWMSVASTLMPCVLGGINAAHGNKDSAILGSVMGVTLGPATGWFARGEFSRGFEGIALRTMFLWIGLGAWSTETGALGDPRGARALLTASAVGMAASATVDIVSLGPDRVRVAIQPWRTQEGVTGLAFSARF